MKILVIGINYYPEITSTGLYTTQMCEWLVEKGHTVSVITGFPYYPKWKIYDRYDNKLYDIESVNGVNIYRSYVYVPDTVTSIKRIIHELSFEFSSMFNLLRQIRMSPDVVISISPPFLIGLHGYFVSVLLNIPFVYHIQDLQIDAAADLQMIKNNKVLNTLRYVERLILKKADLITTISMGMKEKIINKGIDEKKVTLFPNWADIRDVKPLEKNNEFRIVNEIDKDDFVVLYAGNIGEKQGLDYVVDAASLLINKNMIKFLIVGEGAKKEWLINRVKKLNLHNVQFLGIQPKEILPNMLSAADICLVPQQKDVTDIVMPSKLTNILASGTPALVSANESCEVSKVVQKYQCGIVIEPENPEVMAETIVNLYNNREKLSELGINGRKYAEEYLDIDKILGSFESKLKELKDGGKNG
ncbi:WcaI family glycosyltransferase [Thermanaerosceptrum fracticalcis]|uniref:WcaI family glycosyltransferase n=1 Tax=Thermanaerosceptrum fracticalcis TaxID=1712410 RepID=A0A7G6E4U2_THEFR|nr:WcaI family glycosyltransferase [Thermanaerosceptrum fracticalcis]QNB47096.1 WcaI family glycosyltransferase [Thermanaerosceptrum fracticalcis]